MSSMIYTGRFTQVPAVLQRVTRLETDFDHDMKTMCDRVVVWSARVWGVGGRRGRYTRVTVPTPSRIAEMSSYRAP